MTESDNLTRWRASGEPHRWVWQKSGVWCHQEYADLLATLRAGPFWPMREQDIEKTLDAAADSFRDLTRWNLLGDQGQGQAGEVPASSKDEIWF